MKQRRITPETTIPDAATFGAVGVSWHRVVGKAIDLVYEMTDSDRGEVLLRFVDGPVLLLSCDPGYDEADRRTNDHWDTVVYDATDTEAAGKLRHLESGHWL